MKSSLKLSKDVISIKAPPLTIIATFILFLFLSIYFYASDIDLIPSYLLEASTTIYSISLLRSIQLYPILIAVSILSPVSTHNLIPAYFNAEIVSPTLSYSKSSIAVDPTICNSTSIFSAHKSIFSSLFFNETEAS